MTLLASRDLAKNELAKPKIEFGFNTPHLAIVLFSLAMGGFAIGTTEFASMSLLPFFAADLHIDEPTAGHAISAYAPSAWCWVLR